MQITCDEISSKKCLFWLLGISLSLFVFTSSAGGDEKLLKMRLGGFQSKIGTNFAEINSPNNQQPIVLGLDENIQSNFKRILNNKNNIAFLYFDGEKLVAENYLKASGLDYTIVRPGGLKAKPPTGSLKILDEDTTNAG